MSEKTIYDAAVIGGGLAGLSCAILLAKKGYKVVLFEKGTYPAHKVCGEYISMESWNFLTEELGVSLATMHLPFINKILVTSAKSKNVKAHLPLGGFGISRFTLDYELKKIAEKNGVMVFNNCKVENVDFLNNIFSIKTEKGIFESNTCCGSYGKRSNLDAKWKRSFLTENNTRLNNYIGVKYHVTGPFTADEVALHNFKDGYCGLSKIEDEKYCLCYLTKASNLKNNNNSIEQMEETVLYKNLALKNIFLTAEKLYEKPLVISQVSFSNKTRVQDHVLMLGDAAGMITPLCGNGMSIALHTAKLAAGHISSYLQQNISRAVLENNYSKDWKKNFGKRIKMGRFIQRFFGKESFTNIFLIVMKVWPAFTKKIIRLTHGNPF